MRNNKICSYSTRVLISLMRLASAIATHSMHKINSRGYEKVIQIVLHVASSQALSPAPFQVKGGFLGNVETPLPTRPLHSNLCYMQLSGVN